MHVFICINERKDRDACSPAITLDNFYEIKKWLREEGLVPDVFCTKSKCLDFCNSKGGVVAIYPQKKFYKGLTSIDEIKKIILEEYEKVKQ